MTSNYGLPNPEIVQYVPPGHFITLILPETRDFDEFAHEVQTVLTDLLGVRVWDTARVADHGGVLAGTVVRSTTYGAVNVALRSVAERYGGSGVFWSHGWLHAAMVHEGVTV